MKEHDTFPGKVYAVTCASGCTITDNQGRTLGECEAGKQTLVVATSDKLLTSAEALLTATFKYAPAKIMALGLLGGGNSALPSGYFAAEFLESTGTQYLRMPELTVTQEDTIKSKFALMGYIDASANGVFAIFGYDEGKRLRAYTIKNTSGKMRAFAVQFGDTSVSTTIPERELVRCDKTKNGYVIYGEQYDRLNTLDFSWSDMLLFTQYVLGKYWPSLVRFYEFAVPQKCNLTPALDNAGVPCMFDKVSKQAFYNSGTGAFIVGMTLEQARKLGKLPAGTTLTISLPVGYDSDAGVVAALASAEANGCVLTVQTYEAAGAAAATFALRRIWVRKTQDENGNYIAADGTRWQVDWCVDIIGADPEQEGYEPFRSVDAAVAYWELAPYVDPAREEEFLTEHNENE